MVENNNAELTEAYRFINHHGGQFIGVAVNVSFEVTGNISNAVNPGWRTALIDTVITTWVSFVSLSSLHVLTHFSSVALGTLPRRGMI